MEPENQFVTFYLNQNVQQDVLNELTRAMSVVNDAFADLNELLHSLDMRADVEIKLYSEERCLMQ